MKMQLKRITAFECYHFVPIPEKLEPPFFKRRLSFTLRLRSFYICKTIIKIKVSLMSMLTRTKKWEKPKLFILGITALCAYSLFVDLKDLN